MSQKTSQSGKQVFVSFEYERDYGKARDLIARAHRRGYAKPIFDHSLKEPYEVSTGEWVNKARTAIQRSQLVIVIIGSDTHTAPGVEREIKLAIELGKQIIQVRSRGQTPKPHPLLVSKPVILWTMKNLDKYFDSNWNYGK